MVVRVPVGEDLDDGVSSQVLARAWLPEGVCLSLEPRFSQDIAESSGSLRTPEFKEPTCCMTLIDFTKASYTDRHP